MLFLGCQQKTDVDSPNRSAETVSSTNENLIQIPGDILTDKIRGGLLGQIIGNLNGIPHEHHYIHEPGNVTTYEPALPDGAVTDDDTDFEWVYVYAMQQKQDTDFSPDELVTLWKERINNRIWCSNRYARHLMDLGIKPPYTGNSLLNPWAGFNISGQFICETFGLMAPAMPQTAARLGLNFTTITISGEPAQTTQLFTTMIATAFVEDDIPSIIQTGLQAIDQESEIYTIVTDVIRWHKEHPTDWQETRRKLKEKYTQFNGRMRDSNGYELNTGSTIAALLYGQGDFIQTMITGFNFGWDADNNTATAGTILGVVSGYRALMANEWKIVDRYQNTNRENMPMDETITSFADRIVELARFTILQNGGRIEQGTLQETYHIPQESPAVLNSFNVNQEELEALQETYQEDIKAGILNSQNKQAQARAAYLAICLDLASTYQQQHPEEWTTATAALSGYWKIMQNIFYVGGIPSLDSLEVKFERFGFHKPKEKIPDQQIWSDQQVFKLPE